ncbi:Phosphate ABC transporter, periplasmic phosphate-binding protein PstS (TC 3.A.1.7.1) [hydrothermal vent metagenome]|uniref:Phosphate ABC transporter, periplasmic phosphate-binding protein PstS (TC 3.A.1.7.1) n=1 Tax=hydrothermal vent metagenome TaxID=652676 RepID=A0A3B1C122_9ZZZZ
MKRLSFLAAFLTAVFISTAPAQGAQELKGSVRIDGSSTVFPISEAVAEEFGRAHKRVRVTVGISGTGGGFKKFVVGDTDISDASRPIKKSELAKTVKNGIEFIELPVAYDGLSVVINPKNDFVDYLSVAELKKIWQPGSSVKNWSDVRPEWPEKPIILFGPGTDSGTFDYFTKVINGKEQASRADYTASEDDNVLVMGVAGDKYALGYFGYAYYAENRSRLRVVPIKGDNGPVTPSARTINNGVYSPLSRPIFIYVSKASLKRPVVLSFVKFYLKQAALLTKEVGYVPLPANLYELGLNRLENRVTGTAYSGAKGAETDLATLFGAKK